MRTSLACLTAISYLGTTEREAAHPILQKLDAGKNRSVKVSNKFEKLAQSSALGNITSLSRDMVGIRDMPEVRIFSLVESNHAFYQKLNEWVNAAPNENELASRIALKKAIGNSNEIRTGLDTPEKSILTSAFNKVTGVKKKDMGITLDGELSKNKSRVKPKEINLSFEENRKLHDLLSKIHIDELDNSGLPDNSIEKLFQESISPEKYSELKNFRNSDKFALIIRNLPSDRVLPPSPNGNAINLDNISVIKSAILGALECMQIYPVGYQGEDDHSIFRHVSPKLASVNKVSSYGADIALGMHMDNPHLPLQNEPVQKISANPEYLSLTGVRCDVNVPTRIVETADVLSKLPAFVIDELSKPNFLIKRPASFSDESYQFTGSVLVKDKFGKTLCRYDQANVSALSKNAGIALRMFDYVAHLPELAHHILLTKGDLLVFKNQRTLHARDGFSPRFDGSDRWIIRVLGVGDQSRTIPVSEKNPHIIKA